jgi:murein DD-endopeptidase MepM/ murein hydrolase activator NlpD
MRRSVMIMGVASVALAACTQPPARVTYKTPATSTALASNESNTLSFFPRWNEGNIEMAKGETAQPLPYQVASATTGTRGSAGKEAASYYTASPAPAARIESTPLPAPVAQTQPNTPPQQYAMAQPAPSANSYAATPVAYTQPAAVNTLYAPQAAMAPAKPLPADTNSKFQAMLLGQPVTGMGAPVATPVVNTAPTMAAAPVPPDAYSGSIALASSHSATSGPASMYGAPSTTPSNAAAPSLPFTTVAATPANRAPAPAKMAAPNAPSDFVINASGDAVKGVAPAATQDVVDRGYAVPVAQVSSTPLAGEAPLAWPVSGQVISKFGPKEGGRTNDGINIAASAGAPVYAAADGMVIYAGNEVPGYGNMVVLSHADGRSTVYAHAQSLNVARGQFVKQGDSIARVGQTGGVSKPQLHFAVRSGKKPLDPLPLLQGAKLASR